MQIEEEAHNQGILVLIKTERIFLPTQLKDISVPNNPELQQLVVQGSNNNNKRTRIIFHHHRRDKNWKKY